MFTDILCARAIDPIDPDDYDENDEDEDDETEDDDEDDEDDDGNGEKWYVARRGASREKQKRT